MPLFKLVYVNECLLRQKVVFFSVTSRIEALATECRRSAPVDWVRVAALLCLFENWGECLCVSADQADKTDIRYFESRKCGLTLVLEYNLAVSFRRKHLFKVCMKLEKM